MSAEAACVTIEKIVVAIALKHNRRLIVFFCDEATVVRGAERVGPLRVKLLHAELVAILPSVVDNVGVGAVRVDENISITWGCL